MKLGEEFKPKGEDEAIARIVDLVLETLDGYGSTRPVPRAQHAKTHGCVRAQFEVVADVPPDLRVGLFAAPRTYDAWVRFSSSTVPPKADDRRDAHGMAIKVLGVPGEKEIDDGLGSQDFALVNHDVFFCRDAAHCLDFALAMKTSLPPKVRTWAYFFPPRPAAWQRREFVALARVVAAKIRNPLEIRYWSQTPYALGPGQAAKYSAVPRGGAGLRRPRGADGLTEAMARSLRSFPVTFDFLVQRQVDARTMPVEDPTVTWNESASPFLRVATIRIPMQELVAADAVDALAFSPWHALAEHRPLGGINRVRRAVYVDAARLRRERNLGVTA